MAIERKEREPITGISSMAMRQVLSDLGGAWRLKSGEPMALECVGGVDALRRVQAGEAFDFVVLAADAIEQLGASGRVDAASRTAVARSAIAIAVAAGAPHPDIASESAVRGAVINARKIGYSTGPSGTYLARLFERWGIAETIAPRLVQAPPGVPVGTLLARGDVELGFQQLSELMDVPGVDVIGPLPSDVQAVTTFSGAICATSKRPDAARAFLSFLASPAADAAKRRRGMEPA